MTDVLSLLRSLERPQLLVAAARHALTDYRRETHLKRLLKISALPGSTEIALKLLSLEADHEDARLSQDARYSPARHIEVMVALMNEARVLAARPRLVA